MLTSTTLRIDHNVLDGISKTATKLHLDRGTYMRQLIMQAYEKEVMEIAIDKYKKGNLTIGELAEKTNKSVWEMMEILKQRKIESNLTLKDLEEGSSLF